jgi:hypothetical protein
LQMRAKNRLKKTHSQMVRFFGGVLSVGVLDRTPTKGSTRSR